MDFDQRTYKKNLNINIFIYLFIYIPKGILIYIRIYKINGKPETVLWY